MALLADGTQRCSGEEQAFAVKPLLGSFEVSPPQLLTTEVVMEHNILNRVVTAGQLQKDTPAVRPRFSSRAGICLALLLLPMLTALRGWSLVIKVTDPNPVYFTSASDCPPNYPMCYDQAYLQTAPINALNHGFDASFDAWNTKFGNSQWSITNGGFLDAEIDVSIFRAQITDGNSQGGVEIKMLFNYAGADKGDFYWAQGTFSNYVPFQGQVTPFFDMDVMADGCDNSDLAKQCPPLYPYQYGDRHFYDFPEGSFPSDFFNGYAYPVKIDRTNHTLTVYQGVAYGFQLYVTPEPGTLLMLGSGVLWIGASLRRRLAARS